MFQVNDTNKHRRRRKVMNENNTGRQLLLFFIGLGMLVGGFYMLMQRVTVTPEYMGNARFIGMGFMQNLPSGMVILPMILGIVLWIALPNPMIGRLITILGGLIIVLSILLSIKLRAQQMSLFDLLEMMILIFGGGALMLRTLFAGGGSNHQKKNNDGKTS